MVKVSMDRHHRLTSCASSPSKRYINGTIVLYRHGIPLTLALEKSKEKIVVADFEQLSVKSGFQVKELQRLAKSFSKFVNPTTRGLILPCRIFSLLFVSRRRSPPPAW